MAFITEDFMLQSEESKKLYQEVKNLPIVDFHCHLDPKLIYEDKVFENIVDIWLGGDHYKWRIMRAQGISECNITGKSEPKEKFKAWAKTLDNALGNPLYHWTHLELKQIFGWEDPLTSDNWEEVYDYLNKVIQDKKISPRKLITAANVTFIGTTDSPIDTLSYHEKIAQDSSFTVKVKPTYRPEAAFTSHPDFVSFVEKLERITETTITSYNKLLSALALRLDYFVQHGCRMSDHSFGKLVYVKVTEEEMDGILVKALRGSSLTSFEEEQWQSRLFIDLCQLYNEKEIVTQVHFGALRNNNTKLYCQLGSDIGVDSLRDQTNLGFHLNHLLDALYQKNQLPKMIFYNLDPKYNALIANTLANFQANEKGIQSQLQFGAAWWFSDTKRGILDQLEEYANQGLLGHFVGMLTDSRSFLSYPRHDYFRRILCQLLGEWMVLGEIPIDGKAATRIVKKIAHLNAEKYIGV
ncbi:glucuronate isomerase [Listeria monocytogenes]|nr:glucuronate isomerase [Listeria monocytogenes]